MSITESQFLEMTKRIADRRRKTSEEEPKRRRSQGEAMEAKVQEDILTWCRIQWPRWKVLYARTDKKTTIPQGCQDLTVFGPFPLCVLVECKSAKGKRRPDQLSWATEMEGLGWKVEVARSLEDFFLAVAKAKRRQDWHGLS